LDVRELMQVHVEALYTRDERGRLLLVNYPGGKPAPRFFLGRTAKGRVTRFRYDISSALIRDLESASATEPLADEVAEPPYGAAPYETLLARYAPVLTIEGGPAFYFPEHIAHSNAVWIRDPGSVLAHLPEWREDVAFGQPMFGVAVNDEIVSLCSSVRITDVAHEAGVETAKAFRGHGYAAAAVSGWARAVRELGRTPLYSTSWSNESSRRLAAKLGLICYGTTLHIT
jgi:hypothetical protein